MARVSRPDQEKAAQEETLGTPDPALVAQQAVVGAAPAGGGGTNAPAPAAPVRSHFNDLSRLLYANKGQGARMAQEAVQKADTAAAGVNRQLGDAQSRFTQAAQAAVPKAITPAEPPPLVGSGPGGALTRGRTTTRLNTGDSIAQQEQVAGATYKGPASLAETPGVNLEDMQLGLNRAGQEYAALNRNPSHMTGGLGRFNDFLIGSDGAGEIKAAQQRFQGLRGRFAGAVGDTGVADRAAADTKRVATEARATIDRNRAEADAREALRQTAENQASAAAQSEDDYFHEYRMMNPTLSEAEARRYYDSNTDHIKQIIDNNRAAQAGTGQPAPQRGG